jgi:hypothetical protein
MLSADDGGRSGNLGRRERIKRMRARSYCKWNSIHRSHSSGGARFSSEIQARGSLLAASRADRTKSAVDVSVRAELFDLLAELRLYFSYLFISHDLAARHLRSGRGDVSRQDRRGGATEAMFARPLHLYTRAFIGAVSRPDGDIAALRPPRRYSEPDRPAIWLPSASAVPVGDTGLFTEMPGAQTIGTGALGRMPPRPRD